MIILQCELFRKSEILEIKVVYVMNHKNVWEKTQNQNCTLLKKHVLHILFLFLWYTRSLLKNISNDVD